MISASRMAIQIAHNPFTSQDVKHLLEQGKVREAITLLKQEGTAHLEPVEEAIQGFAECGYVERNVSLVEEVA